MKAYKFTTAYLRFHRQLAALHRGKLATVKRLAKEAGNELAMKTGLYQLRLSYSP